MGKVGEEHNIPGNCLGKTDTAAVVLLVIGTASCSHYLPHTVAKRPIYKVSEIKPIGTSGARGSAALRGNLHSFFPAIIPAYKLAPQSTFMLLCVRLHFNRNLELMHIRAFS